ncbi:class I SAM-dependent methyltransferase [Kiritimatiellota bacterium B12222]|nr:class I SAM-dependent methyltransferase [Kiritimatiellota bacterium B12222]
MTQDYFHHKAETYDNDPHKLSSIENIANAIHANITLTPSMHLMDFGSGTGLLLESIAPSVQKITAVDVSESMTHQLAQKRDRIACDIDILKIDLLTSDLTEKFDGIISSMTLHHIEDVPALLAKLYTLLEKNGFIALADLEKEDGSFHSDDTGVHHQGFEREHMVEMATQAGFREVSIVDASIMRKAQGDYPVFLLTAKK